MTNEVFEYLNSWNKTAFDSIRKIAENNIRMSEKLAKEQIDLAKSIANDCSKMMDAVSSCKDPQEAVKKQSEMAEETCRQIMKSASSCAEILAEAGQTYSDLFEANMEAANKATSKAPKKAA